MKFIKGTKKLIPLFTVSFICTGAVVWSLTLSGDEHKNHVEAVRPVKTMVVQKNKNIITRQFPGIAEAAGEIKMSFRVGGPLIEVNVDTGSQIEKNQIIARIDPRDFKIQVKRLKAGIREAEAKLKAMQKGARSEDIESLKANLSAAGAVLEESTLTFNRVKNLFEKQVAPKSSLDQAKAGFEMARAKENAATQALAKGKKGARKEDVEAMEARINGLFVELEAASNALEDTYLKAPFTGIINKKFIENHETVAPGHPVVTLLDFSSKEVHCAVSEDILINKEKITKIECIFDSIPGKSFPASIKEISKKTDMANQSYPVTVTLNEKMDMDIFPGMAAEVIFHIQKQDRQNGFTVPVHALNGGNNGESSLWVVDMATMTVQKREVKHILLSGNSVIIEDGINAGERIVTAGAAFLKPGQQIRFMKNTGQED